MGAGKARKGWARGRRCCFCWSSALGRSQEAVGRGRRADLESGCHLLVPRSAERFDPTSTRANGPWGDELVAADPVEQADAGVPDGRRSSPQGARATRPGSRTRDQIGCGIAQQARGRRSADRQEDHQELSARARASPSAAARGAPGGGDLGGAIPLARSARSRASPSAPLDRRTPTRATAAG
jgi:hypothetical protein